MASDSEAKAAAGGRWLSRNPSKAWGELFFLALSAWWIGCLIVVLVLKLYEGWEDAGYMTFAVILALPFPLLPLVWVGKADAKLPLSQRYWVKANIWIAIFSFIGNYFWTHYFFNILGAGYTMPITWNLNGVPIALYIITHAYFCSYHAFTTPILRRVWTAYPNAPTTRWLLCALAVLCLSYVTAFMEAFTLETFPYYTHVDRFFMYTVGSTFYGLYFFVSFPMFARMGEEPAAGKAGDPWPLSRVVIDALAACMVIFCLCDFWRLVALWALPSLGQTDLPYAQAS